jgi:tRNA A37 methylthiotransferase MiaB
MDILVLLFFVSYFKIFIDFIDFIMQGVKEVTLLGQNVNSYRDISESSFYGAPDRSQATTLRDGFKTVYKPKSGGRRFADLLDKVSDIDKDMRIRFTAAHPKDFPDEVSFT